MNSEIDTLAFTLRLTPYQAAILCRAARRYDVSRIAVRDGVMYVPHATRGATDFLRNTFTGRRGDAVAANKILARNISLKNVDVWR